LTPVVLHDQFEGFDVPRGGELLIPGRVDLAPGTTAGADGSDDERVMAAALKYEYLIFGRDMFDMDLGGSPSERRLVCRHPLPVHTSIANSLTNLHAESDRCDASLTLRLTRLEELR
jgi:hypothetical protein